MKTTCGICPHACAIEEGYSGFCGARSNVNGVIVDKNYGFVTSMALDPIEKKPLKRFYPGSRILSVGSYGCNLRCPFCQNHDISIVNGNVPDTTYISPEELVKKALELTSYGNIGVAYTYNEPLIGYEYVRDCSAIAASKCLKNVVVTNGYINEEPLKELLPHIDAMNIDLKAFTEDFYRNICGHIDTVKRTIEISSKSCHIEVTTLVIPGENDSPAEIQSLSEWLAGVNDEIPLHLTRFFPRYKMTDRDETDIGRLRKLTEIAAKYLKFVYAGNC